MSETFTIQGIQCNDSLTVLDLSSNGLGLKQNETALALLVNGLQLNFSVTSLVLYDNNLKARGAESLSLILSNNHTITSVDASSNAIGDKGLLHLVQGCCHNPVLTELNLFDNNIYEEGASGLASALLESKSSTLERIDAGGNNIGPAGAQAISKLIHHLTWLGLANTNIGDKGVSCDPPPSPSPALLRL